MDRAAHTPQTTSAADGAPPRLSRRAGSGDAVVIVDVDQFAAIRAMHGSEAGEQVTRAVADCLRRRLRSEDRLALLREDEFLAVLPGATEEMLPAITHRLRSGIEGLRLALAGRVWTLSCTIGAAAATRGSRPCGLEGLVREADTELHRARRAAAGRLDG
ncbi:MAG: diguanylate cyclase [Burkholderiales bacterium]|jgi:diguanylate cyclase